MLPINLHGKVTGGPETAEKLQSLQARIRDDLRTTVRKLGYDLELLVKQKLSGPVLKAPTGTLKSSINTEVTETETSIVASVGTSVSSVPYARIHEFGGTIVPRVAEWLVFKTPDGAWHKVKQVVIPERSYLRTSLADKKDFIEQQIRASLSDSIKKAGFK